MSRARSFSHLESANNHAPSSNAPLLPTKEGRYVAWRRKEQPLRRPINSQQLNFPKRMQFIILQFNLALFVLPILRSRTCSFPRPSWIFIKPRVTRHAHWNGSLENCHRYCLSISLSLWSSSCVMAIRHMFPATRKHTHPTLNLLTSIVDYRSNIRIHWGARSQHAQWTHVSYLHDPWTIVSYHAGTVLDTHGVLTRNEAFRNQISRQN